MSLAIRPFLLVLLALAGCGTSGTDGGSDLALAGDLSTVADLAQAGLLGFVTLSSTSQPARGFANATFLPDGPAFACAAQNFGPCTFYSCHAPPPTESDGGSGPAANAGAIDVGGGSQAIHFAPRADGTYDPLTLTGAVWSGGEMLTVDAAGNAVPFFHGAIAAPRLATVGAPGLPASDWMVDRTIDLAFTWSGVSSEKLLVSFGSNSADPIEVECVFTGSDGAGTVPAASLALLPAGSGYFQVVSRGEDTLQAGPWQVRFRADADALAPDGTPFNGGAQFQ